MRHIKPRSLLFSKQQLQQLKNTNGRLHKLNLEACRQLRRTGSLNFTRKHYTEAIESFGILAIQMNFLVRFRERIITDASEQEPDVIRVVYSDYCECCSEGKRLTEPADSHRPEPLKQDPEWLIEIDRLLEVAQRIAERVSTRSMSGTTLSKAFFTALTRLTNALLRQKRHLRKTAPETRTKIEVDYVEGCSVCRRPADLSGEKEDRISNQ